MQRTVDLVIADDGGDALALAVAAVKQGRNVLVVSRSADLRRARLFRRDVREATGVSHGTVTVMSNAEVVCVDGVSGVEAVVIRYRTGRLCAVNAGAFLSCSVTPAP